MPRKAPKSPQPDEPGDILTVAEAAKLLRVSETTVRTLLRNGELPGRRVGHSWRCSRAALEAFIRDKD